MTEPATANPIFFVGGAPRSGTTITHALVCTSARINAYHPEISFLTPIVAAYQTGLHNWDNHTRAFFAEKAHFRLHMQKHVHLVMAYVGAALGQPEIISVKDPLLTPFFGYVAALLPARARFITVVRHPYDVLRSRQEVAEKAGRVFTSEEATAVAHEYVAMYHHLDAPALAGRLFHYRYEDLLSEAVLDGLRRFTGCADISPDAVWRDLPGAAAQPAPDKAVTDQASGQVADDPASKDPWYSPKYRGTIDLTSRLSPLGPEYRAIADTICTPLMERFGYQCG